MIYDYECEKGHQFERSLPLSDYAEPQVCDCGAAAKKIITRAPFGIVRGDVCYDSPIDGRPITSMAARRDDLARNHCQEYDPEMKRDAERFRAREQATLEKSFDDTIEQAIDAMPSRKKEVLERELSAGADATINRD